MSKSNEKLAIWIPTDLNPASQTMDIANKMINDFGVTQINNDTYNNNFNEYYDQHIRHNETENLTFCSKNRTGINVQYLVNNANKKTYVTLLLLDYDKYQPDYFDVLAIIVFKWSATAGSVKIQAFCGNQKLSNKGAGTKLLNSLKKVLLSMNLNSIYLNPIPNAVSYYSKQQFKPTTNVNRRINDSSTPKSVSKSKSKSKSKTKSKTKSKSKSKTPEPPTMSLNIRSERNWNKLKTKMKSYSAFTRKKYGKTFDNDHKNIIIAKTNKILNGLRGDDRDFATSQDIIRLLRDSDESITDEDEEIAFNYLRNELDMY